MLSTSTSLSTGSVEVRRIEALEAQALYQSIPSTSIQSFHDHSVSGMRMAQTNFQSSSSWWLSSSKPSEGSETSPGSEILRRLAQNDESNWRAKSLIFYLKY